MDVKDLEEFSDEFFGEKYFNNEFFIDLPSKEQIKNLLKHFLQKRELEIESVDFEILTKCIQGFSAGEIEEVLLTAIYQDDEHNILTLSERLIKEFKAKELKAITNLKHAAVFQDFAKQRGMQWI